MDSGTEDEDYVKEKDQGPMTEQSIGPPLELVLPSTSHSVPATITDSMSSLAFNLPPCLLPVSEKSPLSSSPSVSNVKGEVRIEAPHTLLIFPTHR